MLDSKMVYSDYVTEEHFTILIWTNTNRYTHCTPHHYSFDEGGLVHRQLLVTIVQG